MGILWGFPQVFLLVWDGYGGLKFNPHGRAALKMFQQVYEKVVPDHSNERMTKIASRFTKFFWPGISSTENV